MEAPREHLIHVETIGEPPTEARAIAHADASRLVKVHPDDAMTPERRELDIDELVSVVLGEGRGQLANFVPDFHF